MGRGAGGSIAPMSNSPADSDPRADADAAQASTGDSPADVGTQQKPVTTPDDAEPAADEGAIDAEPETGTEPAADTESEVNAESVADEDTADAEPETGTEPAADAGAAGAESAADEDSAAGAEPAADTESEVNAESAADEDTANAEPAADEDITDTAAPASAPAPQDPAAPAAPVPTSPGSPPPSTGARPTPATPIPAITAAMGPVPAPPAAPVPPPPAAASMGPVPAATAPAGPVPTGSLPITPFPTGPAPTGSLPVTPFPTGPVPVSSASTGSIPVVPAHVGPAPAGAGPAVPFPTAPVPAPPAVPVPPPPAVTASPRPLQAAAPAGDAPQWSRGQWWTVLVLGVLAAITGAAALVLQYLDLMNYSGEEWWLFTNMSTFFLLSPFALTVVGIVQTCRRAAPSAFVAMAALTPAFASTLFYYFWYSTAIASILHITAMVLTLATACVCLWGRLPHRTRTPRSAVAVSALAMAAAWSMTAKLFMTWIVSNDPYQYTNYTALTWVVVALRTATLICGIALLALMIFHRKVIIVRILAVALGLFILADDVIIGITSYSGGLDLRVLSIPSAVLLIALAVPVFCASFRQWCAGTWTAPAWKPSAVASRPTILARTSQVTDPDGNTLNDAEIAAMLPTTRPTFWVSLFFGLFGLLPMLTANSTARSLGVVTNAYNSAMLKGFVLGILMWTAITAASYTIILFGLL